MAVWPELIYWESATLCAGVAAVTDLRSRRIPNWLTGTGVLIGTLLHFALGGIKDCGWTLLAGLIAGGIFFVLFAVGGMGAGDVKLMAAVCCLAGFHSLANILIGTVVLGAFYAVASAILKHRTRETFANLYALVAHHGRYGLVDHPDLNVRNPSMLRLPYAVPIAGGCLVNLALGLYGGSAL